MKQINRDRGFWQGEIVEYMLRNRISLSQMAKDVDIPYNTLQRIMYYNGDTVTIRIAGILTPIAEMNEEARKNGQK